MRFAIVASRWNEAIVGQLVEGAIDEFQRHGDPSVDVFWVPGTWEIPYVASRLVARGKDDSPDAIVVLGCILQGATAHATMLASDVSSAIMQIQLDSGVPIAWGILTPETPDQAFERSGMKLGNKGREAAVAAIEMASLRRSLG